MKLNQMSQLKTSSILDSQAVVRPRNKKKTKGLAMTLTLTSLVDAFSILVIYLLVSTTSGTNELETKNVKLPTAGYAISLQKAPILKLNKKGAFLDDKRISYSKLEKKLVELKGNTEFEKKNIFPLIIQADKSLSFKDINKAVMSATLAGFNKFKFAVVQEGK